MRWACPLHDDSTDPAWGVSVSWVRVTCPYTLSPRNTLCLPLTPLVPKSKIAQREGGSVGKWSREVILGIYSRIRAQHVGKAVQPSCSSHLAASSFLLRQLFGICWPVPHIPQPLLLFSYSPPLSAAQLWHLHTPLEHRPDENTHTYPIRGTAPASQSSLL